MTRWLSILAVGAAALPFAQVSPAHAQQVIADRVACRGCEIAVTPVVTLQTDVADAYLSGPPSSVVRVSVAWQGGGREPRSARPNRPLPYRGRGD